MSWRTHVFKLYPPVAGSRGQQAEVHVHVCPEWTSGRCVTAAHFLWESGPWAQGMRVTRGTVCSVTSDCVSVRTSVPGGGPRAMEAPLQMEMVELVPNGKHLEGLLPVATPTASNQRVEGPGRSCVEGEGFLQKSPSKEPHFTDFEGKTSFGMSVFNLSNAIMGSGILGLAYAMANTGIILFLFLLTAVALLSSYSIHLLLKSSGIVGIRAYEQLGYRAFGTPGKLAAALAITLQNIGAMSSYLYIIKSELPLVIQTFLNLEEQTSGWYTNGNYLVILVSVIVILPLALMRQLGYLGYSSGFSLSCMVFFLIAATSASRRSSRKRDSCRWRRMPQPSAPRATSRSTHRQRTPSPSWPSPSSATPRCCPSTQSSRNGVESELLHTYSKVDSFDVLILCVRVAVLTAVTLTVPIVLFPVRRAIQQMMFQDQEFSWLRHVLIALSLLTCINLLVIFAPNILGIFGVIGATSAPCLIFIFPAIFYFRIMPIEKEPARSTPKILALCFAALGLLLMTMSLSFIIIDWVSGTSQHGGSH
nr:sodium-coupled neutral amino acid transporter 3 isoform X2 [Camelus dromedarius]